MRFTLNGWPWEVIGQGHNLLIRNILKTIIDTRLDHREHLRVGTMGFRLVPSDLTVDDLVGSKIKVIFLTWNMSRTATVTMLDVTEITQNAHGLHFGWPWEVTASGMWGYTPVRITGALVLFIIYYFYSYNKCIESNKNKIQTHKLFRLQRIIKTDNNSIFDVKCQDVVDLLWCCSQSQLSYFIAW